MKIEYDNFYKFIASVGLTLIAMSVICPWLFLKEPFDLRILQTELESFTPIAQTIIAERQCLIEEATKVIPWVSVVLFVLGLIVFVFGGWLWWDRTQRILDLQNETKLRLLEDQLEKIPVAEIEAQQRADARAQVEALPSTHLKLSSALSQPADIEAILSAARNAEKSLTNVFITHVGDRYKILQHRRIGQALLDMVLVARVPGHADIIFELKHIPRGITEKHLRESIQQLKDSVELYSRTVQRNVRAVLCLIAPESVLKSVEGKQHQDLIDQEASFIHLAKLDAEKIKTMEKREVLALIS